MNLGAGDIKDPSLLYQSFPKLIVFLYSSLPCLDADIGQFLQQKNIQILKMIWMKNDDLKNLINAEIKTEKKKNILKLRSPPNTELYVGDCSSEAV